MDRRLVPGWRAWPIAVLAGAALVVPASAHGATWAVNDTVDTPVGQSCPGFTNCSLREAVTSTEANPGADAILVSAPGTYVLTNGQLSVTQDLEVSRVGAASPSAAATRRGSSTSAHLEPTSRSGS